jgi:hypothetical protein
MYYNPSTEEVLSVQDLRNLVNASFPDSTEEVHGWFLIDRTSAYPSLQQNQYAVEGPVKKIKGKYVQTYEVKTVQSPSVQPSEDPDRMEILEKAIQDLAQMVSNLEEYRVWKESQEAEAYEGQEK